MPSALIPMKEGKLITNPTNLIVLKETEIQEGEKVLEQLSKIENISKTKLGRVRGRVNFLRKFILLLKEGFIPIPRMEFEPITINNWWAKKTTIVIDKLPVEAIIGIAQFKDKFDRLGVVRPTGRGRRRDPILIGIIRYGGLEEHFILGWWRPDIMKPIELW